ncbi:hypothetical protein ACNKHR_04525 [Shigella flexneri]
MAKKHASSIISLKISRCLPRTHKRKVGSICYLNTAPTPSGIGELYGAVADNRQYVVGATLPVLLKEGQYDAAQKLLATLPANEMLKERYAVSVATRNKAESLRLARLLYQQEPAVTRLDQLTWQLMQNEQSREAADLLLRRYPFQGDARVSQT